MPPCAGMSDTRPAVLSCCDVTKRCARHGPLGSTRICNSPKPIPSAGNLWSAVSHSYIQNWNQICRQRSGIDNNPPSYFEMRRSRLHGLGPAHRGMEKLRDVSGDPSSSKSPFSFRPRVPLPSFGAVFGWAVNETG